MTFILASALVGLLAIAMVVAIDKEEAKEMFRGMSQDCKETEGASDADVEMMISEKYPESKQGKCMMSCMQEQFGLVHENKFQKEAFVGLATMVVGENEEKMKLVNEIADECTVVTHDDRCERAVMIAKCLEEGSKKRNFKME